MRGIPNFEAVQNCAAKNLGLPCKPTKSDKDFVVQPLRGKFCYRKIWDYFVGFALIVLAVFFIFKKW
ncbi:MAG TPA: hypothetical protein DE315_00355 [Candidatus Omnitrophica bacterium]|nr:MAG: hypothetical protein A2Y05_03465 [Omnitrophica WOR_2 bacterium GWA2_53_43]HBO96913.1 hypothetical protein [Candidatus Omnitrophota bacterium]HCI43975.1 hypothetical protein [Candidatus Omnitrophota bacterium]